ncbi:MAG TPA: hypothetical protein VGE24_11005 [Emticicia sp.]
MKINLFILVTSLFLCCLTMRSQDLIVKLNGDTIHAKITEVGTDNISYKKKSMSDGPTFVEKKSEIAFIRLANGEKEQYGQEKEKENESDKNKIESDNKNNPDLTEKDTKKKKIEMIYGNFYVNNMYVPKKEVDRLLAHSNNPAVVSMSKGVKTVSGLQKIMKITSYPTTVSGGALSLFTMIEGYQLVQRGRATPKTFLNIGLSLVGTFTFPVTSKLLKKKSEKTYSKLIEMYNVTN